MSRRLVVLAALAATVTAVLALVVLALPVREPPRPGPQAPAAGAGRAPSPPPLPGPVDGYVALGDSFTSGPLIPYVDAAQTNCLRSSANYPAVLGRWLEADRVVDVSCSGADTGDLMGSRQGFGARTPPQLSAVTASTDLVTLGIGGNDFGIFGSLVGRCPSLAGREPTGAPCRASFTRPDGTDRLLALMPRVEQRVSDALEVVAQRAPDAVVAVVGYPRILPTRGTCSELPFAAGDYRWADRVERALNATLARAARGSGALYVDTYGPSRGHDACAAGASWVNGRGTAATRALAYHPYADGMVGAAAAAYEALTDERPTGSMRQEAEQLETERPPGTLTLRGQRVIAALLGG